MAPISAEMYEAELSPLQLLLLLNLNHLLTPPNPYFNHIKHFFSSFPLTVSFPPATPSVEQISIFDLQICYSRLSKMDRSPSFLLCLVFMLLVIKRECVLVDITFAKTAQEKGAVCLDGTLPAYYLSKGSGTGIHNWIIKLGGGGWCHNVTDCLSRRSTGYGSSTKMPTPFEFNGILGDLKERNPDFYNWNRVRVPCCDGGSFTGDVEDVNSTTKLYFRGARIIPAVVEELQSRGLRNAKNVILAGCSAGGLSSILHCDSFKSLLPKTTKVKCLADAGFFINAKDVSGAPTIEKYFDDVVALHGSAKNLPVSCTSKMKPGLCFFPENIVQKIKTPVFIVNSAIDAWQIEYILAPNEADPSGVWDDCKYNISKCTDIQLQRIQEFRSEFLDVVARVWNLAPKRGTFINSCFEHCQTETVENWFKSNSPMLNNKTIAKAVGDWYFERCSFQVIGGSYPGDKLSCRH